MLIHKIIHDGREYVSSTLACEEAYVSHETLRVHHCQLITLPVVDRGSRVRLIAEEDFNASKYAERRKF